MPPDAAGLERIEVRVRELQQLFNSIDPSPFRERDLDAAADEFIEGWAQELPRSAPLELVVYVDQQPVQDAQTVAVQQAVREFYRQKAALTRRRLRDLFRRGRISLLIALVFFGILGAIANVLTDVAHGPVTGVLRESLLIGGWVAMWRPLEVFLYDWWPIRAQAQLYDRLAAMPVVLGA